MKPFQKGDRVFDLRFGFGIVTEINKEQTYQVYVAFDDCVDGEAYTKNGIFTTEENRSLWHADLVELKEYAAGLQGE